MTEIRELTYRDQRVFHGNPSDRYTLRGSYPWYVELNPRRTKVEAYAEAVEWARAYQKRDPYGNMASAHGVIADDHYQGWRGVVNYFHSNT